jgi:hypothetical protein
MSKKLHSLPLSIRRIIQLRGRRALAFSAGGDGGGKRSAWTTRPLIDVMPSRKFVWDPNHWRLRAEETRTVADQMTHEEARTIMRRIALDYDRLAKLAEEQLADQERGTIGPKS